MEVVKGVLDAVDGAVHVRAVVYGDRELEFLAASDAPGAADYRARLAELLSGLEYRTLPHEEIIAMLDRDGAAFRILILKTAMTIPYTSLFINLDCGYWSAPAEQRLRAAMAAALQPPGESRG